MWRKQIEEFKTLLSLVKLVQYDGKANRKETQTPVCRGAKEVILLFSCKSVLLWRTLIRTKCQLIMAKNLRWCTSSQQWISLAWKCQCRAVAKSSVGAAWRASETCHQLHNSMPHLRKVCIALSSRLVLFPACFHTAFPLLALVPAHVFQTISLPCMWSYRARLTGSISLMANTQQSGSVSSP